MTRERPMEPWLSAYRRALLRRREPLIYLLVSHAELERVAAGRLPMSLRRQALRALTMVPAVGTPTNGCRPRPARDADSEVSA